MRSSLLLTALVVCAAATPTDPQESFASKCIFESEGTEVYYFKDASDFYNNYPTDEWMVPIKNELYAIKYKKEDVETAENPEIVKYLKENGILDKDSIGLFKLQKEFMDMEKEFQELEAQMLLEARPPMTKVADYLRGSVKLLFGF